MKTLLWTFCLGCSTLSLAQTQSSSRTGDVDVGDGVRIHYVEGGVPRATTTVLFVPGWSTSTAVWRDQMTALASRARVVSIDPRSQGDSTITVKSNTPEQRAKDLHEVIRSLRLANIVLVGWSQGVQDVAAYAAAFGGESILGYVLVDSAIGSGAAAAVAKHDRRPTLARFNRPALIIAAADSSEIEAQREMSR